MGLGVPVYKGTEGLGVEVTSENLPSLPFHKCSLSTTGVVVSPLPSGHLTT
jgi:hypothetical protein